MSFYDGIVIITIVMMVLLSIMVSDNQRLDKEIKKDFLITYFVCILINVNEWLCVFLNGAPMWTYYIHAITKCLDYIFSPLMALLVVRQIQFKRSDNKVIIALLLVNAVIEVISIFTGWTFTVDEANVYHHGPYYIIYAIIYLGAIAYAMIKFITYGNRFRRQNRLSIFGILALMIIGIVLQEAVSSDIKVIGLSIAIMNAFLYIHISEYRQMQNDDTMQMQERLLNHDTLTGVYSRYAYTKDLEQLEEESDRDDLTIFSIDVNAMKTVNDTMGHQAGDELICGVADCLTRVLAPYGKIYRTGGDEFVAITNMNKKKAESMMEELNLEALKWQGKVVRRMSMSIGFAQLKDFPGVSVERLIGLADKAMYGDKARFYQENGMDRRRKNS